MAKKQMLLGKVKLAQRQLSEALLLGADPAKIEELRREIPLALVKYLIKKGEFEGAGEMLLELELEGNYELEIPELYLLLLNTKNQFKWDKVLDLIAGKKFSDAKIIIAEWEKKDDSPKNLTKLKAHLKKEVDYYNIYIKERREKVRSLIDEEKYNEAMSELSKWENTGEDDLVGFLKLKAYFIQAIDSSVLVDPSTEYMWQKFEVGGELDWQNAIDFCKHWTWAGFNDWKLPDKSTLESMFGGSSLLRDKFPNIKENSCYWTSTSPSYGSSHAWNMNYFIRTMHQQYKSNLCNVRCVRENF